MSGTPGQGGPPGVTVKKEGFGWKPWVIGILAVIVIVFVAQNSQEVEVDFIFASTNTPLIFALALCAGLGFAIGWLFPKLRSERKREKELGKKG